MRHILFTFVLVLISGFSSAQSDPILTLENYQNKISQEKIYLHTDRNVYSAGDEIWVSIYLVDARTHLPKVDSKVVYIELRSPDNQVISQATCLVPNGFGAGDLLIREDLPEGNYTLVGYTNLDRNSEFDLVYTKKISIVTQNGIDPEDKMISDGNIQFFPEGGHCIIGAPCRVAIHSSLGSNENITVVDNSGDITTPLAFDDKKYALFTYTPTVDSKTHLAVGNKQYALPEARVSGTSLKAKTTAENIELTIYSNNNTNNSQGRVIIHSKGQVYLDSIVSLATKELIINQSLEKFGPGVHHITLFDMQWQPLSERLIFIPPDVSEYRVDIDADISTNNSDESLLHFDVPANFDIDDSLNIARLSCSITPMNIEMDQVGDNIAAWMHLNSDLEDEVDIDPLVFVTGLFDENLKHIDMQLMTRGWRTFDWTQNESYTKEAIHQSESGLLLKGRMVRPLNKNKGIEGKVFITNFTNGSYLESTTDKEGYFSFGPFTNLQPESIILQGRFNKKKSKDLNSITTEDNGTVMFDFIKPSSPEIELNKNAIQLGNYASFFELDQQIKSSMESFDMRSIDIEEVVFSESSLTPQEVYLNDRSAAMGIKNPNTRVLIDSLDYDPIGGTAYDLLRNIPGLLVRGIDGARGMSEKGGNEEILMRGSNSIKLNRPGPIIIVDGIPVPPSFLQNLPIRDIEFIDVVRGMRAGVASFGTRAMNGAVVFYLRRGERFIKKYGSADNFYSEILEGLQAQRKFPNFAEVSQITGNKDIRKTIAWEPNLMTTDLGLGQMRFILSDQKGEFLVIVEGLKMDGTPLVGMKTFKVE